MPNLLSPIFPEQIDSQYRGRKLALWLFGFILSIKALQMVVSIVNGYSALQNADGIPLDTYPAAAAQTIVALSALLALTYLMICLIGAVVLIRYRNAVPFMFALLLLQYVARAAILHFLPIVRVGTPPGSMINLILLAVMAVGLLLSVLPRTMSHG